MTPVVVIVLLGVSSWYLYHFIRNKQLLKRALFLEQVENERQQELYKMKNKYYLFKKRCHSKK